MAYMKLFLISIVLIASVSLHAQTNFHHRDTSGVMVHKDPRVDLLIKKQAQINEESVRETRRTAKGYRLLIMNTNKRDEAIAAKTRVYSYYPELKAYLIYQSPYFKVKVGNFKTREEADDMRKELTRHFPKGVFIINDIIEIKPEKREDESRDPEPK